jgi:antagonist of KipI
MPFLKIIRPGMFTTIQDGGRWGFQSRGVPVAGAMDLYSHRLANRLVGNRPEAATLEVTLLGPQMECETAMTIAVAGAEFELTLDGGPVAMNRPISAHAGAILKFGERKQGARAYVAVAGGVLVPAVLNSRSTHVLSGMGGLEGRALRAGDRLPVAENGTGIFLDRLPTQKDFCPLSLPEGGARLRVLPGPRPIADLASKRFQISARSDRMGYRLDGPGAGNAPPGELVSTAMVTGALQVPPTGQPILLMADRATTGGYAVAATVISADLPLAGQLAPGDWIEFEVCSMQVADAALHEREAALAGT